MQADTQAQVTFFLTGSRASEHLDAIDGLGLRPALFAGYRELDQLRYDFPLVLVDARIDSEFAQSLSSIIDNALASVAQGSDGERIRKHALRLEQQIRTLVALGAQGSLSELWEQAASQGANSADPLLVDSLRRTRSAIKVNGAVVDCDALLPARLLRHAWAAVQEHKTGRFRKELDRLVLKLSDILKADYEHSAAGRSARQLQAAVGTGFADAFDFDAMSRLLSQALPHAGVSRAPAPAPARAARHTERAAVHSGVRGLGGQHRYCRALPLRLRELRQRASGVPGAQTQADRTRQGHRHGRVGDRGTVQRGQARRLV